jgi:hypothetical protein
MTNAKRAGGLAQVGVELLPNKREALNATLLGWFGDVAQTKQHPNIRPWNPAMDKSKNAEARLLFM